MQLSKIYNIILFVYDIFKLDSKIILLECGAGAINVDRTV